MSRWIQALLWLTAAGAGAHGLARQDALVALGDERWFAPLLVALAHLPVALAWAFATRRWRWVGPILPTAVLATVWAPALGTPVVVPAAPPPRGSGPSIVLVTLDTLRADRVGARTPALEALAASGVRYTQAVTTAPLTAPAHASMLTGQDALAHGLRRNGLGVSKDTVVDAVRAAGWRTGAFLSARVLSRDTGLAAGFEHYDDQWGWGQRLRWVPAVGYAGVPRRPVQRDGAETVDRALAWLAASPDPAFLWVHLYDAHAPYAPPLDFRPPEDDVRAAMRKDQEEWRATRHASPLTLLTRARVHHQTLMYDACVRYVDHLAGRVIDAAGPDAIVIVVADHGESLNEHDYFFNHGAQLYETALHVPMIVRWPGRLDGGRTDASLVSVQAVAGLLRAAAGLAPFVPPGGEPQVLAATTGQQARHAFGVRARERGAPRQAVAMRVDGGKLLSQGGEEAVWFDLATDPGELTPLPVPTERAALATEVEASASIVPPETDAAQRARLQALGYVD